MYYRMLLYIDKSNQTEKHKEKTNKRKEPKEEWIRNINSNQNNQRFRRKTDKEH